MMLKQINGAIFKQFQLAATIEEYNELQNKLAQEDIHFSVSS